MKIFDRKNQCLIDEKVYGDFFVKLTYGGRGLGHSLVYARFAQKFWTQIIGWAQSRRRSGKRVPSFVRKYEVKMEEFVAPEKGFANFNEFFIRPFKEGQRTFPTAPNELGSPAEGRLTVFPIQNVNSMLSVKGELLSVAKLLGKVADASDFTGGYSFVFRLCPVDYHRFHFPDAGRATLSRRLGRTLHSVNPLAQLKIPDVFVSNERQVCVFESENFGKLALIEVGALGVGKIHQTYHAQDPISRGQEKGYFSFGGSTVIVLSQAGRLQPAEDILQKTHEGVESLVRLGESIGRA